MKKPVMPLLLLALASASSVALADPWKDESGKGRHGREYKQEYWDGNCKVEKKWEKGEYKEERKCKRPDRRDDDRRHDGRYYEQPVVQQRYYPANSNYYPQHARYDRDDRDDRRDPQVNIDVRIRR